jgi:hypothetical protein
MSRVSLLAAISFCVVPLCGALNAQDLCPTGIASDKLVCVIPQVFGKNGIQVANGTHQGHFEPSFLSSSFRPLDSAVARQAALLPLASPSSGITFTWDAVARVYIPSTDSFGSVLSDRAETIGKYRVFLAFDYQYFKFDSIDGIDLRRLPVVLPHQDDATDGPPPPGVTCSINPPDSINNEGTCSYVRDVVTTSNRLDLKIHQFTTFITFGLTNRIDVSAAIPIENVRLGVSSTATIVHNDNDFETLHAFPDSTCNAPPCLVKSFSNFGSASGIGDITLRVKGTAWKGERAGLGLGVDVRVPTGDQLNFTGSGAAGVRPFVVWSYKSRISPHALVGYEVNGSSVIAGDISTGTKDRLPSQLTYSGGADVWLTKWFTAAFDLVGQEVFQARRASVIDFQELGPCGSDLSCSNPPPGKKDDNLSQNTGSYNISNASIGLKIKPLANLLVTGNVLLKLNDGGLRANTVPLLGVSYTF